MDKQRLESPINKQAESAGGEPSRDGAENDEDKPAPEMVIVDGLEFTREQYEYLKRYTPPVNPRATSKEEIAKIFGWRSAPVE